MRSDKELLKKNYFHGAVLLIVLTAIVLGWMSYVRQADFHNYHIVIGKEAINGVEHQIAGFISEKQRLVKTFANDHILQIRQLANNPDSDKLREQLGKLISQYFPNRFAFSIADKDGTPLFEDFDGLISELCLDDIKQFSRSHQYHPYIHPNTEGYHFDVMVRYGANGAEGILFISFLADVLGEVINSIQPPGHRLVLIYPENDNLIEIFDKGARNHWERLDYRLTKEEKSHIIVRKAIANTRWEIVDFHDDGMHTSYFNALIYESLLIFSLFTFIAFRLVVKLRKEEIQRQLAEEQKAAMMSVVSHEFRTPVSIIKSALDLVTDGDAGDIPQEAKKYMSMATANTSQLMHLVNDFLDIQKLNAGKLHFDMEADNIRFIVEHAVGTNEMYARECAVQFTLIEPQDNAIVVCDSKRISQVISNLLTNAAKYGGHQDNIEISIKKSTGRVRVSIKDHGQGIPEDFRDRVFENFTMAKNTKEPRIKSSGLGLSIAKAIVEHHRGTIGFDTQSAIGTTFWFELPTT